MIIELRAGVRERRREIGGGAGDRRIIDG